MQKLNKNVTVIEYCDKVEVYFEFHPKTIAIVKRIGSGIYIDHPRKHWVFSTKKKTDIIRTFRSHGYYVELKHTFPDESDIFSMLSTCKKCGQQAFIGRSGICAKCSG